ncbi:MAG: hypothetical protein K9K64_05205 [Desulfohalobiaceae bacterium]|nr:hypothetical protein [Desulfohalobiaceae bacterium]
MLEIWPFINCLGLGIVLLITAVLWGGILISFTSEIRGWLSGNKFLDKFAFQVCRMSLVGLLVLAALAAAGFVLNLQNPAAGQTVLADIPLGLWIWPLAALGLGLVFQIFSFATWRGLKKKIKWVHLLFSLTAALGLWAGAYAALNLGLGYLSGTVPETAFGILSLSWLPPIAPGMLVPAALSFFLLGIGGGGTTAAGYLLLRRNRDDFGRDYYSRVQPLAARWGMLFLLELFFLVWFLGTGFSASDLKGVSLILQRAEIVGAGLGAVFGFVIHFFLMLSVSRSKTPLRKKGSVILGLIMSWLAVSASAAFIYLVQESGLNLLA